jgi:hypothetical protein
LIGGWETGVKMTRSQKINRRKPKRAPIVQDERTPRQPEVPQLSIDPAKANAPVRTVNLVECGDMQGPQVQLLLQRLNQTHDTAKGGIHYFLPVRHGKIGSDIVFEEEFEAIGRKVFEVVDEQGNLIENASIRLKGGAKDMTVVRKSI